MKYAYEDLSDEQFEDLIVVICHRLFGIGVQGFTTGPDGGRDAKFVGTAELHPSRAEPWKGKTIIQSKHSQGYNTTFTDSEFYSERSTTTTIAKEIPRIQKLKKDGELDNYILFANRRLSAGAEVAITKHIEKECGIPRSSLYLVGIEQLEMYLKSFPEVATIAGIDPIDSPLIVSPEELAEIVETLAKHTKTVADVLDQPPAPRVPYEQKNKLNNMSLEYAKDLRKRYLKDTGQIKAFLAAPENIIVVHRYETVIEEFQLTIMSKRKDHQTFDEVMEYLVRLLFGRDPVLRRNKRLTRAVLFYMYWNCDIGLSDAATQ